ncbi:MAG: hypothetical protein C5B50_14210 [Verrucomicrobia bacterium]|nr:MAG: hypothetical protein C5B50_14210 [Verrucomicrobiota bacterium]
MNHGATIPDYRPLTLGILSDIHYASAPERAQGTDYEYRNLSNPLLRHAVRLFRTHIWMHDPLGHNHLLDRFLDDATGFDYVIANGDFSCNCEFLGVSENGAFQSASECLGKLRQKFGEKFYAVCGDHELGKLSSFGRKGGLRLASWKRATEELRLQPFWKLTLGSYVLIGIVSTITALPVFEPDMDPAEKPDWEKLRHQHLTAIRDAFVALKPEQRVLLFCHDPTALPFLWEDQTIRSKLAQVEQTIIGHLHSNLVLSFSRRLAGIPKIGFLGHSIERFTHALHQARLWKPFKVRLCPALAGIELVKGGGYYTATVDPSGREPVQWLFHHLSRSPS